MTFSRLGPELGLAELDKCGVTGVQKEVSFREASGPTKARFHAAGKNPDGSLGVFEFKNDPGAGLKTNQSFVAEDIIAGGASPFGLNVAEAGLKLNKPMPATSFEVIHFNASGFAPTLAQTLSVAVPIDLGIHTTGAQAQETTSSFGSGK